MKRGELDSRLLILVTLALVAFGLVMVYSATSAAAAVGGSDPSYYLKRQGIYAALGIVLMIVAQRWDYRRLRALAPMLVLGLARPARRRCSRSGPPINGARRWISLGPAVFQPSELAKLALAIWAAALPRAAAARRATCASSGARSARSRPSSACCCPRARPGHGDRAHGDARRRCSSSRARRRACSRAALAIACALGTVAIWIEPYRRARFFAFLHPWHDAQGTGFQIVQAMIGDGLGRHLRRRARPGRRRRSSTCPRRTPT